MRNKYNLFVSMMFALFIILYTKSALYIEGGYFLIGVAIAFQYVIIITARYYNVTRKKILKSLIAVIPICIISGVFIRKAIINSPSGFWGKCYSKIILFASDVYVSNDIAANDIKGIIILFSMITTLIIYLLIKHRGEGLVGFTLFIAMTIMYYRNFRTLTSKFTAAFISLNLFILILHNNLETKTFTKYKKNMVTAIALIIINCFVIKMLPQDVDSIFGNGNNKRGTSNQKAIGYSTFNDSLGGPIVEDNSPAFQYMFPDGIYPGITYFKGATYNEYDGYKWTKSAKVYTENSKETQNSFNDVKEYEKTLLIYPESLKVNSFLAPSFSNFAVDGNGTIAEIDRRTNVFLSNTRLIDKYTIRFTDNSVCDDLINKIKEAKNDKNIDVKNSVEAKEYEEFIKSYDNFKEKGNSTLVEGDIDDRELYTQLPDTITDNTKKLLKKILGNTENMSDYEKVEKICTYLAENYQYTYEASKVPKDVDFVDYFLNTDKKGYCTYFATSLAVLCRLEGIPTRFVTGFKDTRKNKQNTNRYIMLNSNAHAWCEVYMKDKKETGIGAHWFTVDPTPNRYGIYEGVVSILDVDKKPQVIKNNKYRPANIPSSQIIKPQVNVNKDNINTISDDNIMKNHVNMVLIICTIILLLIFIRIIIVILKVKRVEKSKSSFGPRKSAYKYISFLGYKKDKCDTDIEFSKKIAVDILSESFYNIALKYNEEYYSEKSSKEALQYDCSKELINIRKYLKKRNKFKFYMNMFFKF